MSIRPRYFDGISSSMAEFGEGDNPARGPLTVGYIIGAAVMLIGGLIAWFFGVDAEGQSLENVAKPLSARERASATRFQGATPRLPSTDSQDRPVTPKMSEQSRPQDSAPPTDRPEP